MVHSWLNLKIRDTQFEKEDTQLLKSSKTKLSSKRERENQT